MAERPLAIWAVDSMSGEEGRASNVTFGDGANCGDGFFWRACGLQRGEESDSLGGAE